MKQIMLLQISLQAHYMLIFGQLVKRHSGGQQLKA